MMEIGISLFFIGVALFILGAFLKSIAGANQRNYKMNREIEFELAEKVSDNEFKISSFKFVVKGVSVEENIFYLFMDITNNNGRTMVFPYFEPQAILNGTKLERNWSLSTSVIGKKLPAGQTFEYKVAFDLLDSKSPIDVKIITNNPYKGLEKTLHENTYSI